MPERASAKAARQRAAAYQASLHHEPAFAKPEDWEAYRREFKAGRLLAPSTPLISHLAAEWDETRALIESGNPKAGLAKAADLLAMSGGELQGLLDEAKTRAALIGFCEGLIAGEVNGVADAQRRRDQHDRPWTPPGADAPVRRRSYGHG